MKCVANIKMSAFAMSDLVTLVQALNPGLSSIVNQAVVLGILSVHSALFCYRPNPFRSSELSGLSVGAPESTASQEASSSPCCLQSFMLSVSQNDLKLGQGGPLCHIHSGQRTTFWESVLPAPFLSLCCVPWVADLQTSR